MSRWSGKKVYLMGDSISSDAYPWYNEWLTEFMQARVCSGGFSGYKTRQIASDESMQRMLDFSPDLVLVLAGANDSGEEGTVGTFSLSEHLALMGEPLCEESDISLDFMDGETPQSPYYSTAISHIIRRFDAYYYDFKTRAGVFGNVYPEGNRKEQHLLDVVQKPRLVLCTPLPQNRIDANDPFSQVANWQRKCQAIKACAKKYNVPCLDLGNLCRWKMELEPYYSVPTYMANGGIYTLDGLHPNKYGNEYMARIVAHFCEGI